MRQLGSAGLVGLEVPGWDVETLRSLLGFVAQLSTVLWSLVILTLIMRFVGVMAYKRAAAHKALVVGDPSDFVLQHALGEPDRDQLDALLGGAGLEGRVRSESVGRVFVEAGTKA